MSMQVPQISGVFVRHGHRDYLPGFVVEQPSHPRRQLLVFALLVTHLRYGSLHEQVTAAVGTNLRVAGHASRQRLNPCRHSNSPAARSRHGRTRLDNEKRMHFILRWLHFHWNEACLNLDGLD